MSGNIKLEGIAKLDAHLLNSLQLDAVKEAVKVNGASLEQKAKAICPVGSPETTHKPGYVGGTLRRSIMTEITDNGFTSETEPHTEYAGYVEYGTRYMDAQPYMRPAFESVEPQFKKDIKRIVGD